MKLKSKILLSLLATSSAAFAQTAPAAPESTIAYNIGVVSQYRYRGLAQTKGQGAMQGGIDYSNANGLYAGAWASQIQWIRDASQSSVTYKGGSELDLYGGYKFESNGLTYDVGFLAYQYVGNNLNTVVTSGSNNTQYANANTNEVYGSVTSGPYTLKYSYAISTLFGYVGSKGSGYIDATANYDLGNGITLSPHIGHQTVKGTSAAYYPGGLSYTDYSVTTSKDLGNGLSVSGAFVTTNAKTKTNFASNSTGYNTGKQTWVASIKYTF